MMDAEDQQKEYKPTGFDLERLDAMETDESVTGEAGLWKVCRYRDSFVVLPQHKKVTFREFRTLSDVISFLNKLI